MSTKMKEKKEISPIDRNLLEACSSLDIDGVKKAILEGANVNLCDFYEHTPLGACVEYQEPSQSSQIIQIVSFLLEQGADINLHPEDDLTILMMAASSLRSYEVTEFLLLHGADPNVDLENEPVLNLVASEIDICTDKTEVDNLSRIYDLLVHYGAKLKEE